MAGDWIKIELATPDKPEVVQMADVLHIDQDAVVGKLFRVWAWADQNSLNGNAVAVTDAFLDRLTNRKGFAAALRKVNWLSGVSGAVRFTNFERHNGATAKARAETNRRVAGYRQRNGAAVTQNGDHETREPLLKSLPEKRREENTCVSGGLDVPRAAVAATRATFPGTHTHDFKTDFSLEALRTRWPGLDIPAELTAADRYLRKQRGTSERQDIDLAWFERDWLPRAGPKHAPGAVVDVPPEPVGWQAWLDENCPNSNYSKDGQYAGTPWAKLDAFTREFITEKMRGTA